LNASNGDTLLCVPSALAPDSIDFRGKSIELRSTNAIARGANTTTLFANGARLSAPESIALAGTLNIPTGAGISLASDQGISIGGNTFVSLGGSILAQNDGTPVANSPSYTQADVAQLARSLTGWTYPTAPGGAPGMNSSMAISQASVSMNASLRPSSM
jgi:acyl-homoserine lactone acylase PvdQ